jgi:CTP:molybdopterin cytidylyltransferase MocA
MKEPRMIWQPRCDGVHGHPIVWPFDLAERVLALPIAGSPRDVLSQPDADIRRRFVDVDDKAVVENIDTPEDLEQLPHFG